MIVLLLFNTSYKALIGRYTLAEPESMQKRNNAHKLPLMVDAMYKPEENKKDSVSILSFNSYKISV